MGYRLVAGDDLYDVREGKCVFFTPLYGRLKGQLLALEEVNLPRLRACILTGYNGPKQASLDFRVARYIHLTNEQATSLLNKT